MLQQLNNLTRRKCWYLLVRSIPVDLLLDLIVQNEKKQNVHLRHLVQWIVCLLLSVITV